MNPKEKALELGNKFYRGSVFDKSKEEHLEEIKEAKVCALIAAEEVIIIINSLIHYINYDKTMRYWKKVIKEIEDL